MRKNLLIERVSLNDAVSSDTTVDSTGTSVRHFILTKHQPARPILGARYGASRFLRLDFLLRALHSQAFSQWRSALHKSSPQPLLNAVFLWPVMNTADRAIPSQFMSGIQQREGMRHPAVDIQVPPRFLAAVRPALPSGDVRVIVILVDRASHLVMSTNGVP